MNNMQMCKTCIADVSSVHENIRIILCLGLNQVDKRLSYIAQSDWSDLTTMVYIIMFHVL